jgi:hypothetical protein
MSHLNIIRFKLRPPHPHFSNSSPPLALYLPKIEARGLFLLGVEDHLLSCLLFSPLILFVLTSWARKREKKDEISREGRGGTWRERGKGKDSERDSAGQYI